MAIEGITSRSGIDSSAPYVSSGPMMPVNLLEEGAANEYTCPKW